MRLFSAKYAVAQHIGVAFLLILLSQLLNAHHTIMYQDASGYVILAAKFITNGGKFTDHSGPLVFSLLNFDDSMRGYLFPLMLLPLLVVKTITHIPLTALTKLFGSAWAAVLIGGLLPVVWQRLTRRADAIPWVGFIAFVLAFLLFWGVNVTFTLTDIPALTLVIGGFLSLEKKRFGWWLVAGLCLAAATNFRPVYVIMLPIAAGLVAWLAWRMPQWSKVLPLAGLVLGLSLVLLPQAYINYYRFDKTTPFVLGLREKHLTDVRQLDNLYIWHLNAGLICQKYGPVLVEAIPNKVQYIPDNTGLAMLAARQKQPLTSAGVYLKYGVVHPIDFAGIQLKHMFNMLDIDYPSAYILKIAPPAAWYCWLNYSLLYLGVVALARLPLPGNAVLVSLLLALAAAVAICVPIVPETRFALPLHLLLLLAATLGIRPQHAWRRWHLSAKRYQHAAVVVTCYVLWLSVAFAMHSSRHTITRWLSPEASEQTFL